ncbi:AMP-binding protein [Actinocrispum wychmicini]|uniref:Amino acid adenylation domain-containing protein n=1 Tax=Actinocrispum wychmicini TaxID=1213861 RepID=A0A4R2JM72_9PSEU|nr:AMP-binding protein [Actinocrispum wychmicini]TCO61171.1 amino acid adenylation domain-containing protein [Actinocrispum wychmicini]
MPERNARGATMHGLVAEQAAARPDAIAVRDAGGELTYRELHTAAGRVAALLAARGLRSGQLVLVSAPRSLSLAVVLLGVLTAGGAYIAADHRWPPVRLRQVARHASMTLVVGAAAGADLPDALCLPDCVEELGTGQPPMASAPRVSGDDPFCVIFTSGSTGEPKGVLTLHGGTALRLHDVDYARLDQDTVTLQNSPLPWDGFTLEMWAPLVNGGRVLMHDGSPITPRTLRQARDQGVNTMFLTGSLFSSIVQDDIGALGGFRQLFTGAERTSVRGVRDFLLAYPGNRLLHIYGPAETTLYATTLQLTLDQIDGLDDVPLGLSMPETTVTVRDTSLATLPDGEVGEICVGGAGLAAGYVGDQELTAARFVHVDGQRLYRTGDLGWIDGDHRLRFVGRMDRQVKLRGNRLELPEVEAAMHREPAVVEAHAVLQTSAAGTASLVGHYTTVDGTERSAAVRARCVAALPAYAVPTELRHHVRLPVNANGKVDLSALADLPAPAGLLVRDPVLGRLQRLVAEVSGRVPDVRENLVESGLDSLTAMRVAFRVSRDFAVAFTVSDLYTAGSLAATADRLSTLAPLSVGARPVADLKPTYFDWWLREQLLPGDPAALAPSVYRITSGRPSTTALADAVRDLADRHDLLRARMEQTPDGPRLTFLPQASVCPLQTDDEPVDLGSGLPPHWLAPFNLERAPAWRVCFGREPAGTAVVALVPHHWLVDGWSESLLVTDLGLAWRARADGREPVWPGPVVEAGDEYPAQTRARSELETRKFWTDRLAGVERLPLAAPTVPAGISPSVVGRWCSRFVDSSARPELAGGPVAEAVQARILAAWGAALAVMSCRGRYVVGVAYAARDQVSAAAIGSHVELIPVPVAAVTDASRNAAEIAETWRSALEHRSLPLPEMLAGMSRDHRHRALQTVFALQTNPRPELDLGPEWTTEPVDLPTAAPLYPLALEVWLDADGAVTVRLEWDSRCLDETWAEAIRKHLAAAMPRVGFREVRSGS